MIVPVTKELQLTGDGGFVSPVVPESAETVMHAFLLYPYYAKSGESVRFKRLPLDEGEDRAFRMPDGAMINGVVVEFGLKLGKKQTLRYAMLRVSTGVCSWELLSDIHAVVRAALFDMSRTDVALKAYDKSYYQDPVFDSQRMGRAVGEAFYEDTRDRNSKDVIEFIRPCRPDSLGSKSFVRELVESWRALRDLHARLFAEES